MQNMVVLSSVEVEFRGISKDLCELLWLKNLLSEVRYHLKSKMNLYCDNRATIQIAHSPVQHDPTKHVEIDKYFIKEKLEVKIVKLPFVKSKNQLVDVLTKTVSSRVFHDLLSKLGMSDIYALT